MYQSAFLASLNGNSLSLSRLAGIPIMLSVFRRGEKKPDHSSLRLQIATVINTFFVVRGLDDSLLNTSTAIVMRKNFEAFVTQNVKRLPTPLICRLLSFQRRLYAYLTLTTAASWSDPTVVFSAQNPR
jgi:hypothetical protein